MNLNNDKKKPISRLPVAEKKKVLIKQRTDAKQENKNKFDKPQQYLKYLNDYLRTESVPPSKLLNCVESLKVALTNNALSWVHEFIPEGLQMIFQILDVSIKHNDQEIFEKIQYECLRCILKSINNTEGLKQLFKNDSGHEIVARCIDYRKPTVMIQALKVLAALCFLNDNDSRSMGTDKTLSAITKIAEDRNIDRFLPITDGITKTNNGELWSMCLQFINALLSQTDNFKIRMHLRNEIIRTGLHEKLECLKAETNPLVQTQYNLFENEKEEDADEIHSQFDNIRLDIEDINDCFEVLKNTTLDTPAEPYFLSILQHLLFIRDDVCVRPAYYKIIEECVSQIVLHKSGLDPDFSKKHFNVDLKNLIDEMKDKTVEDTQKIDDLSKQLEEALAGKEEALAKLSLYESRSGSISDGKLDTNVINNVSKVLNGSQAPPGCGPPAPPPMPNMGGPSPPSMPGMGGPPPPPMPGMGGPPPPPMPGMGGPIQ